MHRLCTNRSSYNFLYRVRNLQEDKMHSRILLVSLLALTLAGAALGAALPRRSQRSAPDCVSFHRILYPERFRDCDCTYSEWSVVPNSVESVNTAACKSGEAYNETRTAVGEGCNPQTETRQTCLPDPEDRLILALGLKLGNSNDGSNNPDSQPPLQLQKRQSLCPAINARDDPWVCRRFQENRRKRSLHDEYLQHFRSTEEIDENGISSTPLPFDWTLHHSRFRRQTPQSCYPNGIQYVLFLLDISGSVGQSNWNRLKTAVSNLIVLFYRPIHVAVMTFDHQFKLEFCFNCFGSDLPGIRNAIRNIDYRGGLTYTAGATVCACEELLHPNCGLHPYANCIDVVYIIDGQSNDRTRELCDEVRCLHNHNVYGNRINTYAIGIGNVDRNELECIDDYPGVNSAFLYRDFATFENAIQLLMNILPGQ